MQGGKKFYHAQSVPAPSIVPYQMSIFIITKDDENTLYSVCTDVLSKTRVADPDLVGSGAFFARPDSNFLPYSMQLPLFSSECAFKNVFRTEPKNYR
jgi:hypothetical protein